MIASGFSILGHAEAHTGKVKDVIRISTGEYPPLTSKYIRDNGFLNHLIKEAFAYSGVEVEFVFMPWLRSMDAAMNNEVHATSFWAMKEEYKQYFVPSQYSLSGDYVFYYFGDTPPFDQWESLSDFSSYKIGVARGHSYTNEFWNAVKDRTLTVEYVNDNTQNLKKLIAGRLDFLLIDRAIGQYLIGQHFYNQKEQLNYLKKPIGNVPAYVLFSKSNSRALRYKALYELGVQYLMESGQLKKMRAALTEGYYDSQNQSVVSHATP
ncbi:hypothetical protein GCM10007877_30400 [Marinibactrum halimedae]|uniref:Transporter substrate-binding domain-containing protein n=2 Tax=Marinibactrum halimedae TaxID=1444977 RepID=A0AA37WPU8_9GAMM|nr:transporter substrate-binding domain-containing protein [Marinibactrum halimedae]GLS27321.1 hypothetical protein GCM10007877_30400 [Marinibactrum halimedae]